MNKKLIKIRLAKPRDAKAILKIHYNSVHKIASKDYNKKILNDWSPNVTNKRIKDYKKKSVENRIAVVALIDEKIFGFATIVPQENKIGAMYVSPEAKRRGIGTALLKKIEAIAQKKKIRKITLESSITAEKFYNRNGYKSLLHHYFTLKTGRKMKSIKMFKKL